MEEPKTQSKENKVEEINGKEKINAGQVTTHHNNKDVDKERK